MIARKMLVKIACLIACFLVVFAAHDDITLENGGYGNLLVNIKDDVKYHKKIWDNLQVIWIPLHISKIYSFHHTILPICSNLR